MSFKHTASVIIALAVIPGFCLSPVAWAQTDGATAKPAPRLKPPFFEEDRKLEGQQDMFDGFTEMFLDDALGSISDPLSGRTGDGSDIDPFRLTPQDGDGLRPLGSGIFRTLP
ncbi:MAG TPA: hypothetical protein IGS52_14345 [Oscillatoriaceae cyanobacterium M33_DOE_052]|nr:hypothetical protein [Oscillatoriaceae cyanobacterium M33_DOE_052]